MMEAIMTQKVTPFLKCFVLFLFIFTAKVLTSRPNEIHDSRNGIHHVKPAHYVRTFTKYHHRRTIQWNNHELQHYWPLTHHDQPKIIGKGSVRTDWPKTIRHKTVDIPYSKHNRNKRSVKLDSNEFIGQSVPDLNQFNFEIRENLNFDRKAIDIGSGKEEHSTKNGVSDVKKYKVKAAMVFTDAPTTKGPTISCYYKLRSVGISVTPSYKDEASAQIVVEHDFFDRGAVTEEDRPTGPVQVEKCTDPQATCYTLWSRDYDGNITVLGQGCWRSSAPPVEGQGSCDKCIRVTPRLPSTKFCCCTKSYCNDDFTSLKVVDPVIKAKSSMEAVPPDNSYWDLYLSGALVFLAALAVAAVLRGLYCRAAPIPPDVEKGDVMGSGPDSLATGLMCVDNLTLTEHIGQGKFGSVWRGALGSTPVAVKLYSSASTWQKEAAIYALPHLSHSNLLRYYGSDSRPTLTEGARSHLIVLELCAGTLRARLLHAQCTWLEFADVAHGLASALAHLHTPSGNKPCIVHRDVNSNNVLISSSGSCRLADLGLAQALRPRSAKEAPTRYTEAGTLRYLAPEALEGALDLSYFGAALCAVDVYALSLVLWEVLWRTGPAHRGGRAPPYAPPYHQAAPPHPSAQDMQTLVSRNKVRPPLPKGPVPEWRALKVASDTCEECWDHDAEARLTAVCVEERMSELKQLLSTQPPVIHDNKLQNNSPPTSDATTQADPEKRSNCNVSVSCDVTTPLLYYPALGRNPCLERNTHRPPAEHAPLHKSLKDDNHTEPPRQNIHENCLSVARISHRVLIPENSLNEIRSYQRPLQYVLNDVSSQHSGRAPKQTNLLHDVKVEKPKSGIRKFFEKLHRKDTEVKLFPESSQKTRTTIVDKPMNVAFDRPANLTIDEERDRFYEAPCLSPPNKTLSPTMMDKVFKELPPRENETSSQIFAVIVPKAKVEVRKKGSSESINKSVRTASSLSMFKSNSESEDSTAKKRLSSDKNSASSSRASINLELQYIDNTINQVSPFDLSDTSSSEDENLMLLSENGGSKITMQAIPKEKDVLKESSQAKTDFATNKLNKYTNFDNEYSDPNDKENLQSYSVDNPVYLAALNGEITTDLKLAALNDTEAEINPKPCLKTLTIKRQHSLEHVSELFSSAGDLNLQNPAGRVKTPGDLPVAVRRARSRALQKGRANEANRLSLYDDRMMFGNSL